MPAWEEIQTHAKKFIDEGIRMLRSGMHEASFLTEMTAKSANLHVSLRRNLSERYKTVHEIGILLCDQALHSPDKGDVEVTSDIKKKLEKVRKLDEEAADFEKAISKLTVTKKARAEKKKSAKSKS